MTTVPVRRRTARLATASLSLLLGACSNTFPAEEEAPPDLTQPPTMPPTTFTDFPADPVLDQPKMGTPLPADIGDQFGDVAKGAQSGGPCVLEPENGSLVPNNWLRQRFRFRPVAGQGVFEIRMKVRNQINDLRVYTTATTWTMPQVMWRSLAVHSQGQPITFSVRGAAWKDGKLTGMPALGLQGEMTIAPVKAEGSIVYWTTAAGTGFKGFAVGDEAVKLVYDPPKAQTKCVGCHSSTPDGEYVGFSASENPNDGSPARVDVRSADGMSRQPPFLTDAARMLMGRIPQQAPTFSAGYWVSKNRLMLSMLEVNTRWELAWTDLEATTTAQGQGWGILNRGGDKNQASAGSISHDGRSVVYISSPSVAVGVTQVDGDVYTIPFNDRKGGTATPVMGASQPNWHEYYPVFSPDDSLIAFNRIPVGQSSSNNPQAELFVVPASGGPAIRLAANDPPQCQGKKSPGITNSWPRWAPVAGRSGSTRYYFLTFSSMRSDSGIPQLYMAPVVFDEIQVKTYPALPIWNQPDNEGNHTPAWDLFKLNVN